MKELHTRLLDCVLNSIDIEKGKMLLLNFRMIPLDEYEDSPKNTLELSLALGFEDLIDASRKMYSSFNMQLFTISKRGRFEKKLSKVVRYSDISDVIQPVVSQNEIAAFAIYLEETISGEREVTVFKF